jgi:threonine dehydratase
VGERAIVQAMRIALEDLRMLVEPSSAVPIAALLAGRIGASGQRIGVIVSGGNVDLSVCPFLAGHDATSS